MYEKSPKRQTISLYNPQKAIKERKESTQADYNTITRDKIAKSAEGVYNI